MGTFGAFAAETVVRTNLPGRMITKENQVEYLRARQPAVIAPTNQWLDFDDALRTLALARATVRLVDLSQIALRDQSKLEIARPAADGAEPTLLLREGELYLSSRGEARTIPVVTPHARGIPEGTEFLVRVGSGATEFIMFDGRVELQPTDGGAPVVVAAGQAAVAVPGQPVQIGPLKARNIVQWWLYYPAVLDLEEIELPPAERALLAPSLAAYTAGHLAEAMRAYPQYPALAPPTSDAGRAYLAALYLSVGAVDRAEPLLTVPGLADAPAGIALRLMIQAVTNGAASAKASEPAIPPGATTSASVLLAVSYAHQATNNLSAALAAARRAVERSPAFGFAWARVAELEFSFGRTRAAEDAVGHALAVAPRQAQANCVRGFLQAARYRLMDAITSFDRAIELDPALGNAWLGRGLCKRRLGWLAPVEWRRHDRQAPGSNMVSWLSDLQTAAILEPRRSLVRAYAGKAFSDVGDARLARKELDYAAQLDPNDPTPSLYTALELYQQNRPNEAVLELERSAELNDNRAVYRSRLLLDQDQATRRASLAKIYQAAGLEDVALREAARAVSYDYASHSAHQFLAESYDALRDPTRFNLRYETVWFNELLLANLLSPVGAGLLSQNISQQEYSRLFEANRVGMLTSTEYRSDGQWREIASHHGLVDRLAYTLDLDFQHNRGTRPNNDLDRKEWYTQLKYQLTDRDSLFVLTKYQDYESGDNFQHYEPRAASRTFRLRDDEAPIVLAGWHRQWKPGAHTTVLYGHLASEQQFSIDEMGLTLPVVQENEILGSGISSYELWPFSSLRYRSRFSAESLEFNELRTWDRLTWIGGARGQLGRFRTGTIVDTTNAADAVFFDAPVRTRLEEDFWRGSFYNYGLLRLSDAVQLTAGLAYDRLRAPANLRAPPISGGHTDRDQWSPKLGLQWDLNRSWSVRGIYARALGGVTFDETIRLEPTQVAGFPQAFRSVISETEVGSVTAPRSTIGGGALDWRPSPRLHVGLRWDRIDSEVDQGVGVFINPATGQPPQPRRLREQIEYREDAVRVAIGRLLGDSWSVGAHYRVSWVSAGFAYPEVPRSVGGQPIADLHPGRREQAVLQEVALRCRYQHAAGFFGGAESIWLLQNNQGYPSPLRPVNRPDDRVSQLNVTVGWRLFRRRAEVALAGLNLLAHDYRLNSLTYFQERPRERVLAVRVRLDW